MVREGYKENGLQTVSGSWGKCVRSEGKLKVEEDCMKGELDGSVCRYGGAGMKGEWRRREWIGALSSKGRGSGGMWGRVDFKWPAH